MIIFPAIDILNGWCVRLHQGDYEQVTVYAKDPSEMARAWEADGAEWLHVVDLDGAREGQLVNLSVVERLVASVDVPIQLGGGIRQLSDLKQLINLGVKRVVLGTALVTDRDFIEQAIAEYGPHLVAGLDGRNEKVAVSGWRETTDLDVTDLAVELASIGIARVLYTDILVDGTRKGPNCAGVHRMADALDIPVIASGGVATLVDIVELRQLEPFGVEGVIIGSALYEKAFSLPQALEVAH